MRGRGPWRQRGMALVATLFAAVLIMTLLAVMVGVGTMRLREATQNLRSVQALAAADAGAAWVRALLYDAGGSIGGTQLALAAAHGSFSYAIDSNTEAVVTVSTQTPGLSEPKETDHLDVNLQKNPQINETPVQVVSTAVISVAGQAVATRTVTTLLRAFAGEKPYSEVVGVIDDSGLDTTESPGDPAGQTGGSYTTELLISSYVASGTSSPKPANRFENSSWFDGNSGQQGLLP
jgi:hypothetical protein